MFSSQGTRPVPKMRTKKFAKKKSASNAKEHPVQVRNRPLRSLTEEALRSYLKDLNGDKPSELYELVIGEVEPPLFATVMDYAHGNQTLAANILGINRATLRKKLKMYRLLG